MGLLAWFTFCFIMNSPPVSYLEDSVLSQADKSIPDDEIVTHRDEWWVDAGQFELATQNVVSQSLW
jgi:hypothetical protein